MSLSVENRALVHIMGGLVRSSAATVPRAAGCAVMCIRAGPNGRVQDGQLLGAASEEFAAAMALIQHSIGEGPDHEALAGATAASASDVSVELARWPAFVIASRGHHLRAVHAEPLLTPDRQLTGVMTWYAKAPGAFPAGCHRELSDRALGIACTLALARRFLDLQVRTQELSQALAARGIIRQAVALLMERHYCDSTVAFGRLRREADSRGLALSTVAAVLVDRAERQTRSPGALVC